MNEIEFEVKDAKWISGRGVLLTGPCPFDLASHNELVGRVILCGGNRGYFIRAVEVFAKGTPPRKGEPVGLLV